MNRYLLDEVVEFIDLLRSKGYCKDNPISLARATTLYPEKEARFLKEVVSRVNLLPLDPFENLR